MPYVSCLTNTQPEPAAMESFKAGAAAALAKIAGKPESYLFVSIQPNQTLYVRGQNVSGALLRVELIGRLSGAQKNSLSAELCRLSRETLGVEEDSVYIIFNEVAAENWGWNGSTFG